MSIKTSNSSRLFLSELSNSQRDAVTSDSTILFINAGPGSGKTKVLTSRVAHFVLEKDINPAQIAVLTFTNKAATEMKQRIAKMIGEERSKLLLMGTFHSFCNRMLRNYGHLINLDRRFTILDRNDSISVVKKILKKHHIILASNTAANYFDAITKYKNKNTMPEDIIKYDGYLDRFLIIYTDYQNALKEANSLDFEDLLILGLRLLQSNKFIAKGIKRVLIDEYQDTNLLQNDIILQLCSAHPNLTVVFDPDQSIYTWRSADINNFKKLRTHFPHSNILNLEQNFRSTKSILQFANMCISQDKGRLPKVLFTENPNGPPVYMRGKLSPHSEAAFVAKQILTFVKESEGQIDFKDFAVLVRASSLTRVVEEEFNKQKIFFKMVGGLRFYERAEIKDIISYLKIIQNPYDITALLRIINVPPRKIGDVTLNKLEAASNSLHIPIYDVLLRIRKNNPVPGFTKLSGPLLQFVQFMDSLQEENQGGTIVSLIRKIVEETNYIDYLKKAYPENFKDRIENVQELIQTASDFGSENNGLLEFLEMVCLYSDDIVVKDKKDEKFGAVTVCTLHASKGLEWPFVFIIGADNTLLPHSLSTKKEEIDEERRLLYVGITRSKTLLHLTWPKTRPFMNGKKYITHSPFLSFFNEKSAKNIWTKQSPQLTKELFACFVKTSGKKITSIPRLKPRPDLVIISSSEEESGQDSDDDYFSWNSPISDIEFVKFSPPSQEKKRSWRGEPQVNEPKKMGFVSSKSLLSSTPFSSKPGHSKQMIHEYKRFKKE